MAYAREGAPVACIDLVCDAAEETAAIIRSEGGNRPRAAADVTDSGSVAAAVPRR